MPTGPNPYTRLPSGPNAGESATQVLAELRDADVTMTSVQPIPSLRDAARTAHRNAASALDLPLWRPQGTNPPPNGPSSPTAVEQTDIGVVVAQVVDGAHINAFAGFTNDVKDEFRQWRKDISDTYLAEQREMYAALRDLDAWAMNNGFVTATARHVGSRLARKELSPEDALAEIAALG